MAGQGLAANDGSAVTRARAFHVAGIGASAGCLAALRTLFSTLPGSPGIAFVVVVHLPSDSQSRLPELLQPYTPLPVRQVKSTVKLEPNRIYVVPPNANIEAIDSHLRLSELEARRRDRAPIDHFFRTLAATHDGMSIGVILTGAGSDGALGLRQVKESGGLTVAQDPSEAEHPGMPERAIETGMVDIIVPVRRIATEIVRFCTTRPVVALPEPPLELTPDDEAP